MNDLTDEERAELIRVMLTAPLPDPSGPSWIVGSDVSEVVGGVFVDAIYPVIAHKVAQTVITAILADTQEYSAPRDFAEDFDGILGRAEALFPAPATLGNTNDHDHDPGGCTCGCPVSDCDPCGGPSSKVPAPTTPEGQNK